MNLPFNDNSLPDVVVAATELCSAEASLAADPQYHLAVAVQKFRRKHDMLRRQSIKLVNLKQEK